MNMVKIVNFSPPHCGFSLVYHRTNHLTSGLYLFVSENVDEKKAKKKQDVEEEEEEEEVFGNFHTLRLFLFSGIIESKEKESNTFPCFN